MNNTEKTPATEESVWAALREIARRQEETDRILKESIAESRQQKAEYERRSAKFDREMAESKAEYDRRQKDYDQKFGSWANNFGAFAEEYFFNSFENGKFDFFGEEFDDIEKNMKGYKKNHKDEYDIVLFNCKSIALVEVKFKAHENDLPKVVKKAETFRINYPEFQNHKIYLGLATMAFYPELEQECKNEGIAVIKQDGDNVIINYDNLKAF